ncbi:MAG: YdeI/OmpD-associated family protein [Ignavibacteriales bacterium]|nr:YdeI/OmpD-associated family protein [Ignavibacteriales bacterium]
MANTDAFNYFNNMSPSYKKAAIHWVNSAKQEITQQKRLRTLIEDSAAARKIKPLSY